MQRPGILRRGAEWAVLAALALGGVWAPVPASGMEGRELDVASAQGAVKAWLFQAPGEARRPTVLILPGRQGADPLFEAYSRYASKLAARGLDACIVSYYGPGEAEAMAALDQDGRRRMFAERAPVWAGRVRAVAGALLAGAKSNGRAGIVGFSQGGYLGVACAAADEHLSALVVMYGGIPGRLAGNLRRLPPLLAFHGQADQVVPFAEGAALVNTAKSLGGFAELVTYPGEGHGFGPAASRDARERTESFLLERLR
ncbi:dienelactone hydrolase family protein [Fundidesulfovibrio terrae]|uniref:dienelactone hydrolase family protein n=1 Tax=Fundidesulfovibrio terrae TaxID=2922866 RepID=UPI001FAE8DDE|nr:dienelactone hydrolase family protein [Fundidesulfovibrio terrae]